MSRLTLHKDLYRDVPISMPGVGDTYADYEVITAIEPAQGPTLRFKYFNFEEDLNHGAIRPETVTMPRKMAKRVLEFCGATFVDGQDGFNCYSFVDFSMGWDDEIRTEVDRLFTWTPVKVEETKANEPYCVYAPGGYGGMMPHVLLGAPRAGHALNVLGPNMPLAVCQNADLLRTYGSSTLCHLLSYERVS